jgi:hypothetical protein
MMLGLSTGKLNPDDVEANQTFNVLLDTTHSWPHSRTAGKITQDDYFTRRRCNQSGTAEW